jgi:hypothetical protein
LLRGELPRVPGWQLLRGRVLLHHRLRVPPRPELFLVQSERLPRHVRGAAREYRGDPYLLALRLQRREHDLPGELQERRQLRDGLLLLHHQPKRQRRDLSAAENFELRFLVQRLCGLLRRGPMPRVPKRELHRRVLLQQRVRERG